MKKNFKKLKSNFLKTRVLIITLFLGFLGLDDLYIHKFFRFSFRLVLFISFIIITVLAKMELDKTESFLQKLLDFAKNEATKRVDSNEQDYNSNEGIIKLLSEVSKLVFEKALNEAIVIAVTLFAWVSIGFLLLLFWMMSFLSTLIGFRRDGYGLRIKYSGMTIEQFLESTF